MVTNNDQKLIFTNPKVTNTGCPVKLFTLGFFAILSASTIPKYKNLVSVIKFRKFAIR